MGSLGGPIAYMAFAKEKDDNSRPSRAFADLT